MMAKTHAPLSAAIGGISTYAISNSQTLSSAFDSATGHFGDKIVTALTTTAEAMSWDSIALVLVVTMAIGGYALAPDFDEPGATIAVKTGPIGAVLSPVVRVIAGGHRKGTHSIWGIIALSALGWFCAQNVYSWVALVVFGCYLSVALVTGTRKWWVQVLIVALVGVVAYVSFSAVTPLLGAALVGGGALLHVLEDMVAGKVKFFWPVPMSVGLDWITTDGPVENSFVRPLA